MTSSGDFLSTVTVVAILACVALLAVVSAIATAPLGRFGVATLRCSRCA
jgi:hypothetical protein